MVEGCSVLKRNAWPIKTECTRLRFELVFIEHALALVTVSGDCGLADGGGGGGYAVKDFYQGLLHQYAPIRDSS